MTEKWQERLDLTRVLVEAAVTLPYNLIKDELAWRRIARLAMEKEQ